MIWLFIEDVLEEKTYELQVSQQLSFYDVMCYLRGKDNCFQLLVYEKYTKNLCDVDVSFHTSGVQNGMYFLVI